MIKCYGSGRDGENEKSLYFYFNRRPTDDELRYFDEVMKRAAACSPIEETVKLQPQLKLV